MEDDKEVKTEEAPVEVAEEEVEPEEDGEPKEKGPEKDDFKDEGVVE